LGPETISEWTDSWGFVAWKIGAVTTRGIAVPDLRRVIAINHGKGGRFMLAAFRFRAAAPRPKISLPERALMRHDLSR